MPLPLFTTVFSQIKERMKRLNWVRAVLKFDLIQCLDLDGDVRSEMLVKVPNLVRVFRYSCEKHIAGQPSSEFIHV